MIFETTFSYLFIFWSPIFNTQNVDDTVSETMLNEVEAMFVCSWFLGVSFVQLGSDFWRLWFSSGDLWDGEDLEKEGAIKRDWRQPQISLPMLLQFASCEHWNSWLTWGRDCKGTAQPTLIVHGELFLPGLWRLLDWIWLMSFIIEGCNSGQVITCSSGPSIVSATSWDFFVSCASLVA